MSPIVYGENAAGRKLNTFRTVVDSGDLDRADKLVKRLKDANYFVPASFYRLLLGAAARSGDAERGTRYFEDLERCGPPKPDDWCALLTAMGSMLPRGRRRLAETAQEMAAEGYMPDGPTTDMLRKALGEPFVQRTLRIARERGQEHGVRRAFQEDGHVTRLQEQRGGWALEP